MAEELNGLFASTLKRNNKQIRDDRAAVICESTELVYKRKVEDLIIKIRQLRRERDNMLDLSPTNAQSLVLASDFDENAFVAKDVELGIKIREHEITLEIATARYNELFGPINSVV